MTPEEKDLLKRVAELSEENNDMLRSMRRSMRLARFMSILYWVVIIGSAIGAYYFIQPYIDFFGSAYGGAKDSVGGSIEGLGGILDTIKGLTQ